MAAIDRRSFLTLSLAALTVACAAPAGTATPQRASPQPTTKGAATAAGATPVAKAAAGGKDTLLVAIPSDIDNFDPVKSFGNPKVELTYSVYERLLDYKVREDPSGIPRSDGDNWAPALAERVEAGADGQTYTFTLRKGVRFYPSGREVNAGDVRWSLERQFGVKSGAGVFQANDASIFDPNQLEIVDGHTLKLTTKGHNPLTLAQMRFIQFSIYDSETVKQHTTTDDPWAEKWLAENTVGTGPYYVEKRDPGVEVVLARNPNYWGEAPQFTRVRLRILPSKADRILLLSRGQIDFDSYLGAEEINALKSTPGLRVISEPSAKKVHLNVRLDQTPWNDLRVRQALAHAVPKQAIVEAAFFNTARPIDSLFSPNAPGFDDSVKYAYDVDKARALLADAGKADGFQTTLFFDSGIAEFQTLAVLLQTELAKLKINAAVQPLPTVQYNTRRLGKDLPGMMLTQSAVWLDDPGTITNLWFTTKSFANFFGYSNPEVDRLYSQWANSSDADGRAKGFAQVQRQIATDVAVIPVVSANQNVVLSDKLDGYVNYIDLLTRFAKLRTK